MDLILNNIYSIFLNLFYNLLKTVNTNLNESFLTLNIFEKNYLLKDINAKKKYYNNDNIKVLLATA